MAVEVVARGCLLAGLFACTLKIFLEVNKQQDVPYMDEIFHIPQAQNYCHNNFDHWDNKITTLPGLYIASQLLLKIGSIISGKSIQDICSCFALRLTNLVFLVGLYFIVQKILEKHAVSEVNKVSKSNKEKVNESVRSFFLVRTDFTAFVIVTFPLLYFFTFLYYTDVGSTFFVLLSYYLSMQNWFGMSAMLAVISVFFRQTNIVWTAFICASAILELMKERNVLLPSENLVIQLWKSILGCFTHFKDVCIITFPYAMVFLGFLAFVIKNNGIVVGDRSSHEPSLNFPQMLYFAAFTAIFANFTVTKFVNFNYSYRFVQRSISSSIVLLLAVCIMIGSYLSVRYFTQVHIYLLSDNRHYTFYIWNRFFQAHWAAKYAAIPVYLVSLLLIINELTQRRCSLWVLLFMLCTAMVLVPQKLLEFRYFILPYLIFRVNLKTSSWFELVVEFLSYSCINAVTIYLFVTRTFTQNELKDQRFMW